MTDFRRYKCHSCGVIFLTDLELCEMRACPVCVAYDVLEITDSQPALCECCGQLIAACDSRPCLGCGAKLCGSCFDSPGRCVRCSSEMDWLNAPAQGMVS